MCLPLAKMSITATKTGYAKMPHAVVAAPFNPGDRMKTVKQNRFETLSAALESENIAHMWDMRPIPYGETLALTYDDGTRYGHYVSVYRDERGLYERPVHYRRG